MQEPSVENGYQAELVDLLLNSFAQVVGRPLLPDNSTKAVYCADFPVLAHNGAEDPVLTYGNLAAQKLWEMSWEALTVLPSRLTAETAHRAQRDAMFAEMRANGFIENYSGVRISASGRRFEIRNAVIWPLLNETGQKVGEAATFKEYSFLK